MTATSRLANLINEKAVCHRSTKFRRIIMRCNPRPVAVMINLFLVALVITLCDGFSPSANGQDPNIASKKISGAKSDRVESADATVNPPDEFRSIFDGKSLTGWRSVPAKGGKRVWSVQQGSIVGRGRQDKLAYLVWKEKVSDFELKLKYRLRTKGNTGIEIRAIPDPTGQRPFVGYHADLGHVGIGDHILGAWDFHFAKRKEYRCRRGTRLVIGANAAETRTPLKNVVQTSDISRRDWNQVHIVANGKWCWFAINGKPASEFTDQTSQRLRTGWIGLQIHDADTVVEFKDIRLKKFGR